MNKNKNNKQKQLRTPVSKNFSPKRLAINFQPPMIILQYLVIDTGKLYHHKIRLDSLLKKSNITRQDVLNYIKTKHHLYFIHGKLKDAQLYKFIDIILAKKYKIAPSSYNDQPKPPSNTNQKPPQPPKKQKDDDFDYLNDQQQQEYYEQDYQDYQDPSNFTAQQVSNNLKHHPNKIDQKNKFVGYKQQNYVQGQNHVGWDLDLDQNDDFV